MAGLRVLAVAALCFTLVGGAGAQRPSVTSVPNKCGGTPGVPSSVKAGVYQGTQQGGQRMALQVGKNSDDTRMYFDLSGVDIALTPYQSGSTLILQESVQRSLGGNFTPVACYTLKAEGEKLTGTYKFIQATRGFPVNLQRVNVAGLALKLRASPGLQRLRSEQPLAFLKLNYAWPASSNGETVTEKHSGITYPRVPGSQTALNALNAVNAALQDRQLAHILNALECHFQLPEGFQLEEPEVTGYELNAYIALKTGKLLSISENVSAFCGGAHGFYSTSGFTFDLQTGKNVNVPGIWSKLTPAQWLTLYRQHYPVNAEADCLKVINGLTEPEFQYVLTRQGVELTPGGLPHVAQACAESVTLPYLNLKASVNPTTPYLREFYK